MTLFLKKPKTQARDKELNKLTKEFENTKEYMKDAQKIFMGQFSDRSSILSRTTDSMKKFSVATFLGNVPILMLTEFAAPLFRYAFKNYIQDGLIGAAGRLGVWKKNLIKTHGKEYSSFAKGMFADADLIGIPHRFVIGEKSLANNEVEYKSRCADVSQNISLESINEFITELMLTNSDTNL